MESKIGMNGPTLTAPLAEHANGKLPRKRRHYLTFDEQRDLKERLRAGGDVERLAKEFDLSVNTVRNYRTEIYPTTRNRAAKTEAIEIVDAENRRLSAENDALRRKIERLMTMIEPAKLLELVLKAD